MVMAASSGCETPPAAFHDCRRPDVKPSERPFSAAKFEVTRSGAKPPLWRRKTDEYFDGRATVYGQVA
jgi:hypothetical protein